MRVLFSFPHPIGGPGIGTTAFHQVEALGALGVDVTLICTRTVRRPVGRVITTFGLGKLSLPQRVIGVERSYALHDRVVARHLARNPAHYDVVHCWPSASLATARAARRVGIPSLLERPSAHTGEVLDISKAECAALGITLDPTSYAAFSERKRRRDELEFEACDFLLCPSDHVVSSSERNGISRDRLLRHQYGFDPGVFHPDPLWEDSVSRDQGLRALVVGVANPIKGVHIALQAWLASEASRRGTLTVCGTGDPAYLRCLGPALADPSVRYVGFQGDIWRLMRESDVLLQASLSEGSALVTYEAPASGCVVLASANAGAPGEHGVDALIHGGADELRAHLDMIESDRRLLASLRNAGLEASHSRTWADAGGRLAGLYGAVMEQPADQGAPE